MIYDCFLFNNELEILEIRLNELSGVVDKFVITESTVTHMNKPKPLHFYENRKKFEKYKSQIIHNVVEDSPDVTNPWIINDFQFSAMVRGLKHARPEDTILFGDADEIPSAEKVILWSKRRGRHKVFQQWLSYYYLNYASTKPFKWPGTHMMKYKELKKIQSLWIAKYSKIDEYIPQGGWHFSYIGGIKRIQEKISSQAHQEYNTGNYNTPENILKGILKGEDFMGHGDKFRIRKIEILPKYVRDNKDQFGDHLLEKMPGMYVKTLVLGFLPIKHALRIGVRNIRGKVTNI